jgi:FAD/FMN-containing dehydrogenase
MQQEDAKKSLEWITRFYNDLSGTDADNILPGTYISLTPPEKLDLSRIYGSNYKTVLDLKREYDPHNVFKLAVPMIR